jgi:hypothetical protein
MAAVYRRGNTTGNVKGEAGASDKPAADANPKCPAKGLCLTKEDVARLPSLAGAQVSVTGASFGHAGEVGVMTDGSWSGTHVFKTIHVQVGTPGVGAGGALIFAHKGQKACDVVGGVSKNAQVGIFTASGNDSGNALGLSTPGFSAGASFTDVPCP